jgi:2-isopropylmalate synthase
LQELCFVVDIPFPQTAGTMKSQIEIYDTTLRDGAQGEGINFSVMDKLRIAEKLDAFGVHYIEGGWPGSNPKDLEFFNRPGAANGSPPKSPRSA